MFLKKMEALETHTKLRGIMVEGVEAEELMLLVKTPILLQISLAWEAMESQASRGVGQLLLWQTYLALHTKVLHCRTQT